MNIRRRRLIAILITVVGLGLAAALAVVLVKRSRARQPLHLSGVVLRADPDPGKQVPVPGAVIEAVSGSSNVVTKSDAAGSFTIDLEPSWERDRRVALTFRHDGYAVLETGGWTNGQICIARMLPLERVEPVAAKHPLVPIGDVRVRYSIKSTTTTNVGSVAKAFQAANQGPAPCDGAPACSPDGKWRATLNSQVFDAGAGNEFRNARLSCIAGPCPFSKVTKENLEEPGRIIRLSVLNWADTVTYFLEAEVAHTAVANIVRYLYPFISGPAMNFTLPPGSQGPSVEADLGGSEIVFPLGPALRLSWATCSATPAADHTKQFRCELKDGYEFRGAP
jgi:hypothetical protein